MADTIWIVGAGAVGQYLAARLSDVAAVTLVARGPRVAGLRERGITLEGAEQRVARVEVVASEDGARPPAGTVVLHAVKATQLAESLGPRGVPAGDGDIVVLCQNGIGIDALAAELAPAASRVRAACWFGVALAGDAVRVAGMYQVQLGADGEAARAAAERLGRSLAAAGLPVTHAASVAECEWKKSLWNLAVSGTCALLDAPNGAILDDPGLRALAGEVLAEARAVAAREGVTLSDEDLARVFASTEKTRANYNAMVHDLRRGGPTESPFLAGAVARLAERHGLDAPVNRTIARLVAAREARPGRQLAAPILAHVGQ